MNLRGFSSIRFLLGFLAGVGILVWFAGISLSKNISERVEKASVLFREMQEAEHLDPEKLNDLLSVTVVSGVRG